MFVRDRMSAPAVTVRPETTFLETLRNMREGRFRRLPVVDAAGQLVGIVSESDLLHASPSPATSLSIWEINYLLWQLRVDQIMTRRVLTAHPDMAIEDAARMLVQYRVGGLPVVDDGGAVVGVITETDIFRALVELLGAQEPGVRAVVAIGEKQGDLGVLVHAVEGEQGEVVSLSSYAARDGTRHRLLKATGIDLAAAESACHGAGASIVDLRISGMAANELSTEPIRKQLDTAR